MVEEKMTTKSNTCRKTLVSALIVLFIVSISQASFGIGSYRANTQETEDEDTAHAPVIPGESTLRLYDVKVDMEIPQEGSGPRQDPGDVEYWALVIGISDYQGTESDLEYCDDDAIDISSALITYHGWDSNNIFLLLDSEAIGPNLVDRFETLLTLVDSNDVFLFTFSGHGTIYPDVVPLDESDGYDEVLVLHDFVYVLDDWLENTLGLFATDKIMVFLDSCHSGGFIKGTSDFRDEDFVSRTLPGTQPVNLVDSFSRDLDKAGFVVLTACDDDELSYEIPALQNGLFTYYFVEGIESGFPADTNTNDYISAEEAFYYASPLTTAYISYQHPQLYDGVPGELEFTAFAHVSINVDPNDIDFGPINKGETGTYTVTVTNSGNTEAFITASLSGEAPVDFYTDNLKMFEIGPGYVDVVEWNLVLPSKYEQSVSLELTIPYPCPAEDKTAILVFWAEIH